MASRSCVSGCGRFLTSSDGHDRCPSCLGFRHAEAALVDESCSHCGNMTMAMLRSRYLLARRGGIPLALPRSSSSGWRTTSAQGQGDLRITVRASPSSTSPRASHSSSTSHRLGFPGEYAGSSDRAGPSISFGAPADDGISITASGDELGSGEDDSAALPPSGRVALPESDPELTAMLSRAAESIGLHYRRPPSPERSRLDDWFLGTQAERRQPPPVPFFPEVHEEVTRSWKAPFSARNRPSASSVLTTLDGGAAQGYVEVPSVERAISMQLCPQGAAAWRGNPRLPSRACKFSSALTAKAYGAAGQAASALHAMALLQVHQAKALKQLHEGDADPGVLQELRTATDLALGATKVTARALGQTMSTLVVQERPCDGRPGASGSCSSGDGDSTTPSPGGGPGGEFLFCSATGPLHKSSFLFLWVPRGRGWQCARPRLHIPIPLSLRQWAAGSGPRTRCLLPRPLPSRGARWVLHHTLRPHFETLCLSSRAPGLHCAAPTRVRLCLPWSRLYGPWGPG